MKKTKKHHRLILAKTTHKFSLAVKKDQNYV